MAKKILYPFDVKSSRQSFHEYFKDMKARNPNLTQEQLEYWSQRFFWEQSEKAEGVPWTGASSPPPQIWVKNPKHTFFPDGFGPASFMWPPVDWTFNAELHEIHHTPPQLRRNVEAKIGAEHGLTQNGNEFLSIPTSNPPIYNGGWVGDEMQRDSQLWGGYVPNTREAQTWFDDNAADLYSPNIFERSTNTFIHAPPATNLSGLWITKIHISASCQAFLLSKRNQNLLALEDRSRARILVFDPYQNVDGSISDTALVYIQGSQDEREAAVGLITKYEETLSQLGLSDERGRNFERDHDRERSKSRVRRLSSRRYS